jgi:hypothetical protein
MASQNINQYYKSNLSLKLSLDSQDMSLANDERDYNEEVIFSPYLIAQTYGNRLPFYFDINNPLTVQDQELTYKNYNVNNIFVSQNYYNPNNEDLSCFSSSTSCDIGLTGVDNGLVDKMSGETINFTKGIYSDFIKCDNCDDKLDSIFAAKFMLNFGEPLTLLCSSINLGKDFTEIALNFRVK